MPLGPVTLRPGVVTMATPVLNQAGVSDANLVRFRMGLPEKWAGWTKYLPDAIPGTCRALETLTTLAGDTMLAIATTSGLYLSRGGSPAVDVTPIDGTFALASGAITTANGSQVVSVDVGTAHGRATGDRITFDTLSGVSATPSGITVGGITLAGDYIVQDVPSSTTLTFFASTTATSGTAYFAGSTLTCYLGAGQSDSGAGTGWGAGPYSSGGWGEPATVSAIELAPRVWSLDAWGQNLLATPGNGKLYEWAPDGNGNITDRAAEVTNGVSGPPHRIGSLVVSAPERHVILLGASALGAATSHDPMLVRWSSQEDNTTYLASSLNTAGSFRLQGGTELVAGYNTHLTTLLWSDTSLTAMQYVGLPYVYSFTPLGHNCGLIAPAAMAEMDGTVFWMSQRAFYRYRGGAPELLPCPVLEHVFNNLTFSQRKKIACGVNIASGEVLWFYPRDGATENNAYVSYCPAENAWSIGTLARTAWLDNPEMQYPVAAQPYLGNTYLQLHEQGADADGQAMGDYLETGFWRLADGEVMSFASQILPDFQGTDNEAMTGSVTITVLYKNYPHETAREKGPFIVSGTTRRIPFRVRARFLGLRIGSLGTGCNWRLGGMLANTQPDGLR